MTCIDYIKCDGLKHKKGQKDQKEKGWNWIEVEGFRLEYGTKHFCSDLCLFEYIKNRLGKENKE